MQLVINSSVTYYLVHCRTGHLKDGLRAAYVYTHCGCYRSGASHFVMEASTSWLIRT